MEGIMQCARTGTGLFSSVLSSGGLHGPGTKSLSPWLGCMMVAYFSF